MIQGSVDDISTERVIGWIHSPLAFEALKVQATINNAVVGEAVANMYRPDLAEAGVGSGHCGFEIRFQHAIDAAYLPFLEVRPADGTLALPRTTTAGFGDYFSGLYKRYPAIGRYASILGGLWTDRSDAIALLKARTDIGAVTQRDSGILSRFIMEGLVVVDLNATANGAGEWYSPSKSAGSPQARRNSPKLEGNGQICTSERITEFVAHCLFNEQTLRLLTAILEDNPIAVKANVCEDNNASYMQMSGCDDLPSPTECVGLITAMEDGAEIEVLRGSHRFPEFSPDGVSRWTFEGQSRVAAASVSPNTYTDVFSISANRVALIGPGLIHRVLGSNSSRAIRILLLPSRQGQARFRQQVPTGEISHRSGARIWLSESA